MHTVHQDFENFLRKHKKEHAELNLKISKLSEVGHKTLDGVDEVRDTVEKYATMMTCLTEFSSISQALAYQDEFDKSKSMSHPPPKAMESQRTRMCSDTKRSLGASNHKY
jgi:tRNA splicing ligase